MNKLQILELILEGKILEIDNFDISQVAYPEDEVVVMPQHVRKMLNRFLNDRMTDADLNKWARFICLRVEYVVPGENNYEINDYYEDMYYVIQRLSTPEIDGEINNENAKQYLTELEKYPPDSNATI